MARNRQRAKQRQQERREERLKARREHAGDGGPKPADTPERTDPDDAGDVGRLAAETGGPPQNLGRSDATDASPPPKPDLSDEEVDELFLDEEDFEVDQDELADAEKDEGYAPRGRRGDRPAASGTPTSTRGPARVVAFLRASWAELQRVQWPDRRQLTQLTAIVLVFIVIMGSYLGILDAVFSRLIQEII